MAKGNSGISNGIKTIIVMLILAGVILGWAKINNINSITGAYGYFKALSDKYASCGPREATWWCRLTGDWSENSPNGGSDSTPSRPNGGSDSTPSRPNGGSDSTPSGPKWGNDDGTDIDSGRSETPKNNDKVVEDPNNPHVKVKSVKDYKTILESIKKEGPKEVDYVRSEWRHWLGSPCNARKMTLIRDGKDVTYSKDSACKIISGEWVDFYKPKDPIVDSSEIDIDHVIPLSYAAKHGGQEWTSERKEEFANDMSQLLAVSASENRGKGDKGPSEYMPPNKDFHCTYSKIWIDTVSKYDLSITVKDAEALDDGLLFCNER